MKELYSNADDCLTLAKYLKRRLKYKIEFQGSTYQEVVSGKYHCLRYSEYMDYEAYLKDTISFCYKFLANGFLRITIEDHIYQKGLGIKLAALSDFYEVLSEMFGEPTVFYTIKDDDRNGINLQWSFVNKEEDIENLKNGTFFDDGETEELIFFNETTKTNNVSTLNPKTKKIIEKAFGIPFELLQLVDLNIEDFIKYKFENITNVPIEEFNEKMVKFARIRLKEQNL